MTIHDALRYEVGSSPWVGYISWKWAQGLASHYLAWKVKRKWNRHLSFNAVANTKSNDTTPPTRS